MRYNESNFNISTQAAFKPFDGGKAIKILKAFEYQSSLHNEANLILDVDGETYYCLYASTSKQPYFSSPKFSFYFRKHGGKSVIRISDHWSKTTGNEDSRKLNCGSIGSSYWTCFNARPFYYHLKGERSETRMIAGICSFATFREAKDPGMETPTYSESQEVPPELSQEELALINRDTSMGINPGTRLQLWIRDQFVDLDDGQTLYEQFIKQTAADIVVWFANKPLGNIIQRAKFAGFLDPIYSDDGHNVYRWSQHDIDLLKHEIMLMDKGPYGCEWDLVLSKVDSIKRSAIRR